MQKRKVAIWRPPSEKAEFNGVNCYVVGAVGWPKGYTGRYLNVSVYSYGSKGAIIRGIKNGNFDHLPIYKWRKLTNEKNPPYQQGYYFIIEASGWERCQKPMYDKKGNEICP